VSAAPWTRVRVDLDSIRHNAGVLASAAGRARLTAVVKADAYGHGAVPVARAALDGGAHGLAVVSVEEVEQLRDAGIDAPLLMMGPLAGEEWRRMAVCAAEVTVWTPEAVAAAATAGDPGRPLQVHLKLDTGMGRLGARPEDVAALTDAAVSAGSDLRVVGLMTHFASADETEGENAAFMREHCCASVPQPHSSPRPFPERPSTPRTRRPPSATRPRRSTWCDAASPCTDATPSAAIRPHMTCVRR